MCGHELVGSVRDGKSGIKSPSTNRPVCAKGEGDSITIYRKEIDRPKHGNSLSAMAFALINSSVGNRLRRLIYGPHPQSPYKCFPRQLLILHLNLTYDALKQICFFSAAVGDGVERDARTATGLTVDCHLATITSEEVDVFVNPL